MAKKKKKSASSSRPAAKARAFAKEGVSKVMDQMKEPFSLLQTLREEGMANAAAIIGIASGAAKNLRLETIRPQLFEVISSLGFALRSDLEKLEARIEELEMKLSEQEFAAIRNSDDE